MGEWVKAAEAQLELHRWLTGEFGLSWIRGWIDAESRAEPAKAQMYRLLAQAEPEKLLTAQSIWVSPEMGDLVDVARESFTPETLEKDDFLVHTGFLYFARPVYMLDRHRRSVSVGAISWCPVRFTSKSREEVHEEFVARPMGESGSEIISYGSEVEEDRWGMSICLYSSTKAPGDYDSEALREQRKRGRAGELVPLHYTVMEFGDELDEGQLLDENENYTAADEWWKLVQTTLRLMQQRVAVKEDVRLPRADRRRIERQGGSITEVLLIHLRRPDAHRAEPDEPSGRTLTHRHLRDGHWRNQWYESVKRHRQIWIAPTIVGDESLPLVIKRRFYKWDR